MAANATTKIQVNYGKDGSLINIYADNQAELEALLTTVQDLSPLINSVLASVRPTGSIATATAAITQAFPGATPVATPAAAPAQGGHQCRHGQMVYREGVSARGPWKGYMCAAPQGTPKEQKCDAIFVK